MESNITSRNKITCVVLDFNGVITNIDVDWNLLRKRTSNIAGVQISSLLAFFEEFHNTAVFDTVCDEIKIFEEKGLEDAKPTPYVLNALEKMSEANLELYVATMQTRKVVEKFLSKYDILKIFEEILTRKDFPNKRSQIEYIINKTNNEPQQTLLIDDSRRNIETCKQTGIICIHFPRNNGTKDIWESIYTRVFT